MSEKPVMRTKRIKTLVALESNQIAALDELKWHFREDRSAVIRRAIDLFLSQNIEIADSVEVDRVA